MLLLFFLSNVFGEPVRPNGWEKRTDARPYISSTASAVPQIAAPLDAAMRAAPGLEVHVRTTPGASPDDWRARIVMASQPLTFRLHRDAWPGDDWVWYQILGRVQIKEGGRNSFGLAFQTGDAGVGCFGHVAVGGATAVAVDLPAFFAKRRPKDPGPDELVFTGPLQLAAGTYDLVVTTGCHPTKIGRPMPAKRLDAWRNTRVLLVQQGPSDSTPRLLRMSDVTHAER